jgi:hypothetical protein
MNNSFEEDFFLMHSLKKTLQKHAYRYYVTITVFDIKGT